MRKPRKKYWLWSSHLAETLARLGSSGRAVGLAPDIMQSIKENV